MNTDCKLSSSDKFWLLWWFIFVAGVVSVASIIQHGVLSSQQIRQEAIKQAIASGHSLASIECANSAQLNDKEYLRICMQK